MENIRGMDDAEEQEDLGEVEGKLFAIITEHQDTMHGSLQTRHTHDVDTAFSLTTQ